MYFSLRLSKPYKIVLTHLSRGDVLITLDNPQYWKHCLLKWSVWELLVSASSHQTVNVTQTSINSFNVWQIFLIRRCVFNNMSMQSIQFVWRILWHYFGVGKKKITKHDIGRQGRVLFTPLTTDICSTRSYSWDQTCSHNAVILDKLRCGPWPWWLKHKSSC